MDTRYQILSSGGVFDHQTRSIVLPIKSDPAWREYQKWLTAGNTPLPPSTVTTDDLATAKAKRIEEIDAYAAGLRNSVVAGRSVGEMASWSIKYVEARAYLASGDPLDAPMVAEIAKIRGITIAAMVGKVMAQAAPAIYAETMIDGIRGKHSDTVDAMTDVRDVAVYDWQAGWPTI